MSADPAPDQIMQVGLGFWPSKTLLSAIEMELQIPVPTGTITSVDVLIDIQGTADLSQITFNGQTEVPVAGSPASKAQCKHGGWRTFTSPSFKNQGQCVSWVEHHVLHHGKGKGH